MPTPALPLTDSLTHIQKDTHQSLTTSHNIGTMKWNIANAAIGGTTHKQNGERCQDFARKAWTKDFACITMADGAGTASHAVDGASVTAEETKRLLKRLGESLFYMDEAEIRQQLLSHLRERLKAECLERGCAMVDLSTTLIFFATDGKRYAAANIGDGMVGRIGPDGQQEIILAQDLGAFVNECHFITDSDSERHIHVARGDYDPESVYLSLTDGSCECLFNDHDNTFAPALHIFAQWMRKYPQDEVTKALHMKMRQLFPRRTDDDSAIALLTMLGGSDAKSARQNRQKR